MTVAELIEKLNGYPPDAPVIFSQYSEWEVLDAEDVQLTTADEKIIAKHHGRYMRVHKSWLDQHDSPEWATVVTFPGN